MKKRFAAYAILMALLLGGCSVTGLISRNADKLPEPDGTVPMNIVTDEEQELLDSLPYYGETGICRMGSRMALAYADTLSSLPAYFELDGNGDKTKASRLNLNATLYDVAGDGFPILIASYIDDSNPDAKSKYVPMMYSYADGDMIPVNLGKWKDGWRLELCVNGDSAGFCVESPTGATDAYPMYYQFYNVGKGEIRESYTVAEFKAEVKRTKKEELAVGIQFPGVNITDETAESSEENPEAGTGAITVSADKLERADWLRMGDKYYYYLINGEPWDPDALEYHTDSPLNDALFSVGLQLPGATGDRLVYNTASGLAQWLPTQDAKTTTDILYELASIK